MPVRLGKEVQEMLRCIVRQLRRVERVLPWHQVLMATFSAMLMLLLTFSCPSRASSSQTSSVSSSQVDSRERGIALCDHGDMAGAVSTLQAFVKKEKNDIRAWHSGDDGGALLALESAAVRRPQAVA